jgi:hypothetical protein
MGSAICGAKGDVELTGSWRETECLTCVMLKHPMPDQRERARRMLGRNLPDLSDPRAVEEWLTS